MPRKPPPPGDARHALAAVIASRRKRARLTQEELGLLVDMGQTTIAAYENARIAPPIDVLLKLASACDMALSVYLSPLDGFEAP